MTDKIVYVHADHQADGVTITTPKELDELLADGWKTVGKIQRTKVAGKMVDKIHLTKSEPNRGLSVARNYEGHPSHRRAAEPRRRNDDARPGRAIRQRQDDPMRDLMRPAQGGSLAPAGAGGSFLGGGSDFANLPGMQVGNSMVIGHAYSLGTDAYHAGAAESDCPWPGGNIAATQWVKGYRDAQKAESGAGGSTQDAYEIGKQMGRGDKDLQVHCPYPEGTTQYDAWIRGFKESGGEVE